MSILHLLMSSGTCFESDVARLGEVHIVGEFVCADTKFKKNCKLY